MTDVALDPAQGLAHRIGAIDYRLQVPALSQAGYLRMQHLLVRRPVREQRRAPASRRSTIIGLIVCMAIGAVAGVMASAYDVRTELWIAFGDVDDGWIFGGRGVLLLAFLLVVVTAVAFMWWLQRAQGRLMRGIHAAGGELFGAHELLIGEHGLFLHNVARSAFVPWSAVTGVVDDDDGIFIVADHVSAFWITEAVLAALPDRAAFLAYLDARIAAHPRADRGTPP